MNNATFFAPPSYQFLFTRVSRCWGAVYLAVFSHLMLQTEILSLFWSLYPLHKNPDNHSANLLPHMDRELYRHLRKDFLSLCVHLLGDYGGSSTTSEACSVLPLGEHIHLPQYPWACSNISSAVLPHFELSLGQRSGCRVTENSIVSSSTPQFRYMFMVDTDIFFWVTLHKSSSLQVLSNEGFWSVKLCPQNTCPALNLQTTTWRQNAEGS